MTPQEQELIQNVANKLKASPQHAKDPAAEQLINQEIGSQADIVYKMTQAVLVQEMALKDLKAKNDFLQSEVEHYKKESERGTLDRMMGGKNPPPVAPQPTQQPSAFGSFMQTAASVAAGMVVGSLISDALFGGDETASVAAAAEEAVADVTETAAAEVEEASSFLGGDSGFASEYTDSAAGADLLASSGFESAEESSAAEDFGGGDDFGGDEEEV